MSVADGVGEYVLQKLLVCCLGADPILGDRGLETAFNRLRYRSPDRLVTDCTQVLQHVIDHSVTEKPQRIPVFGVERC
jgi:hypothetical protein